jgi:low affinity Fe/Cu permease
MYYIIYYFTIVEVDKLRMQTQLLLEDIEKAMENIESANDVIVNFNSEFIKLSKNKESISITIQQMINSMNVKVMSLNSHINLSGTLLSSVKNCIEDARTVTSQILNEMILRWQRSRRPEEGIEEQTVKEVEENIQQIENRPTTQASQRTVASKSQISSTPSNIIELMLMNRKYAY